MTNVLELRNVSARYGSARVLDDITLEVPAGGAVALLGPNGAGKTTLLRVASGLVAATTGKVLVGGVDVTHAAPARRAKQGLCLVPEGRGVFPGLTVRENLRVLLPTWVGRDRLAHVLEMFPALRDRLDQTAGTMSGGQQQMLALSRAWLACPRIVMLDEVSMGLAPTVVDEIFAALEALLASGTALLIVEQYVDRALAVANQVYLLNKGVVVFRGRADQVDRDAVLAHYLGRTQH